MKNRIPRKLKKKYKKELANFRKLWFNQIPCGGLIKYTTTEATNAYDPNITEQDLINLIEQLNAEQNPQKIKEKSIRR